MIMRLWSLNPAYLDDASLRELWDDCMRAKKQMERLTEYPNGSRPHPQLLRFFRTPGPLGAFSDYMWGVLDAIAQRGLYCGAQRKNAIPRPRSGSHMYMSVTAGQMEIETWLYGAKLVKERGNGEKYVQFWSIPEPQPHPLFQIVRGAVERWEMMPPYDYPKCKVCGFPILEAGKGRPRERCRRCKPPREKTA